MFDSLDLDDDLALNKQVEPVATVEGLAPVDEGQGFLPFNSNPLLREFECETGFIGRLQQSGSEFAVHVNRSTDDFPGQRIEPLFHEPAHLQVPVPPCKRLPLS